MRSVRSSEFFRTAPSCQTVKHASYASRYAALKWVVHAAWRLCSESRGFQFYFIFENSIFFLSFHLRWIFITYVSSAILENTLVFENTASAILMQQCFQNWTWVFTHMMLHVMLHVIYLHKYLHISCTAFFAWTLSSEQNPFTWLLSLSLSAQSRSLFLFSHHLTTSLSALNLIMSTNHHNNTGYVVLYLLEMDLTIGEGLADLSQTPKLPSTSTTSNCARPATRASRTRNQDTGSSKYFVWSNDKVLRLVTILFDSNYYQKLLLKGWLTKEQEKGLKTSKEMLYKQIYDKIFPNSNITNGSSHVKTKLCWLESQYIAIKNTFSQTGSGLLLRNLSPDHLVCSSLCSTLLSDGWLTSAIAFVSSCMD